MNARQRRKLTRAMQRKAEVMKLHNVVEGFTDACLLRASLRDMTWIFRATPRKRCHSREGRHRINQIQRLQDKSPRLQRLRVKRAVDAIKRSVEGMPEALKSASEAMVSFGEAAEAATPGLAKLAGVL